MEFSNPKIAANQTGEQKSMEHAFNFPEISWAGGTSPELRRGRVCMVKNDFAKAGKVRISLPFALPFAINRLVCVAEVCVPGTGKLWPGINASIHPRREGTLN